MPSMLLSLLLQTASAADVGVVGVHDPALTVEQQTALMQAVADAIESSTRHDVLLPPEVAEGYAGREDLVLQDTFLADGRRRMEDGRLLYQQAEHADAVMVLEVAVRTLEENVRWARSIRDLWEAWMLLATARLADGQEPAARDAIGAAIALHAARRPDPAAFPPEILDAWERERALATDEAASLSVIADVEGARVWLDGRDVGTSPVTIPGVLPGRHFVHVRSEDGRVGFLALEQAPGADGSARVTTSPPVLGAPAKGTGARSSQISALYEAIGRYSRVDVLVLVGRIDGSWNVQLFSPEADTFDAPVALPLTATEEELIGAIRAATGRVAMDGGLPSASQAYTAVPLEIQGNALLARDLYTPLKITPPLPVETPPPVAQLPVEPEVKRPKWPIWLGIGLGGVAVAAGATALGLALSGGETPEPAGGTITIGPPVALGE
jgi:hypothetical protein